MTWLFRPQCRTKLRHCGVKNAGSTSPAVIGKPEEKSPSSKDMLIPGLILVAYEITQRFRKTVVGSVSLG